MLRKRMEEMGKYEKRYAQRREELIAELQGILKRISEKGKARGWRLMVDVKSYLSSAKKVLDDLDKVMSGQINELSEQLKVRAADELIVGRRCDGTCEAAGDHCGDAKVKVSCVSIIVVALLCSCP